MQSMTPSIGSRDPKRERDRMINRMRKGKYIPVRLMLLYRLDVYYRDRARWEHMDNSAKKEQRKVETKQE